MKILKGVRTSVFLVSVLGATDSLYARCVGSPDLSASVVKFEALQVSPMEALLRFGQKYDLCFGVEYIDGSFLRGKSNFTVENTTTKGAIEKILGSSAPLNIEIHYGVIEILPRVPTKQKQRSVFDRVIPDWKAQRGSVQLVSWLLHISLVSYLNPQIKGFGGNFPSGDLKDEVGPFSETNKTVRYLLDKIVTQSSGASWIAVIPPGTTDLSSLEEGKRAWTILEYQGPNTDFAGAVNVLATQLP